MAQISALTLTTAMTVIPMGHSYAAPAPTTGAIMQQAMPPAPAMTPPPAVLSLPAPQAQAESSNLKIPVKTLVIDGNKLLPAALLHALVQPAEGQSLTLGELRDYVARITSAYQAHGYPLAYAYLPAQQIRDGVIHIGIVEPNYDAVQILGHARLRVDVAKRTLGITPGTPVAQAPLDRGLLLLDQTPGVKVNGVLVPGAQPRTSTLQVNVADEDLVSGDVYTSNYGNRYTGSYVVGFDTSVNDPFGYGSSIAFNGMYAPGGHLKAGGFNLNSPYIWNGLRLGVYGSYTDYHLGGSFTSLLQRGHANQLGADLSYPLILRPGRALNLRFDVLQNWLGQKTLSVGSASKQSITLERVTLSGVESDHWQGITTASLAITQGNLAIGDAQAKATDALGPKARGNFETALLQIMRTQSISYGFTLTPSLTAQIASKNLDSSQQLYLGGPYGVMSYPVGEGGGDAGYLADVHLSHALLLPSHIPGQLQASILAQTGAVWVNHNVYAGYAGANRITEMGVGGELTYDLKNWHGQIVYVHQAGPANPAGLSTHGGQIWFLINYSF
ncbi:ShlB/FhaC/HecB family hemolysin secretion/activation protein [Acidocella aquatica]|nr:POTRA domain-containing protein [Acidocella aquatica]